MLPSPDWSALLEPFREQFTQPGYRYFCAFVMVLAQLDRRLLVTHVCLSGLVNRHFTCFYRFLREGAWSVETVSQCLWKLCLSRCVKEGQQCRRVFAAIDDTVAAKFGKCFEGLGIHHDPMNRSHPKRLSHGHCFVCLALLAEQSKDHFVALFIRAALYVQKKACKEGKTFATKLQLATSMLGELTMPSDFADVAVIAIADGAYAKRNFVKPVLASGKHVISRLRSDTVFYDFPEERPSGRRGRPRRYGMRHKALEWAASDEQPWEEVTVILYGKSAVLTIKTCKCLHRSLGAPLRIVAVRWAKKTQDKESKPVFLFATDTEMTAAEIVRAYGSRFAIETGFRDSKQGFGFSTYQVRKQISIERIVHLCLWAQTLLRLRFWNCRPTSDYGDWRRKLSYLTLLQQKQAARNTDGILDTSVRIDRNTQNSTLSPIYV
jgi:hypothetical protein